jgi:tetratricopeptide (TPR) repeat protein
VANDDFLVPAPRPFTEASIEIAQQPTPKRGSCHGPMEAIVSVPGGRRPSGLRGPAGELRDRRRECDALDRLLDAVRAGDGRALVVRGEPGVGKTALLDYLAEQASGCRVARAVGVESEMELAYAGVHQLLTPMLARLQRLPGPQRQALRTAFGLSSGPAPDRFLVGLATLSLLADVAEEHPLVCLVEDEQWLDRASAQVLAFVARRLVAESVGLVFAARVPSGELAGLPEPVVEGLPEAEARALLDAALRGPLDARVRDRILAETGGNPLALLELPRGLAPAELAGGFALPSAVPLSASIQESFRRRLEALPEETRWLLLVAAAEPIGDPVLVWRAAERLGLGTQAATSAAEAGLLEVGARVRFRHPLVRSAAYRSASTQQRQAVHRALAEVTDPAIDPDRRAWHWAHAAPGPDEEVAAELERSAGRAQARAGLAAAAAFLERSVALTRDPARRTERALAAAQASFQAGAFDAALGLLATAEGGTLDELQGARVDLLLDGLAQLILEGRAAAATTLLRAGRAVAEGAMSVEDCLRWGYLATAASNAVWDDESTHAVSVRQVQVIRDAGALAQLPVALAALGVVTARSGDFAGAAALIAEADGVAAATGSRMAPYTSLRLLALRGREAEASALIASTIEQAAAGGQGMAATNACWAAAVLYNGLGRYQEAAARQATANTLEPFVSMWARPELVEAAARVGDPELARGALERLAEATQPAGTDFGLGVEARSRALLSDGAAADDLYREAIDRLRRTKLRPELARAHLLYGEWLRREGRRLDAREQLRTADDMFAAIGMDAFADRAHRELLATGETARKRSVETSAELTPQEALIARLARDGLSNPEIGTRLFISARTVQYPWARSSPSSTSAPAPSSTIPCPATLPRPGRGSAPAGRRPGRRTARPRPVTRASHWRMRTRPAPTTLGGPPARVDTSSPRALPERRSS